MNEEFIRKEIQPYVQNNQLTYDDFNEIFGSVDAEFKPKIKSYIKNDLGITFVQKHNIYEIEKSYETVDVGDSLEMYLKEIGHFSLLDYEQYRVIHAVKGTT